MPERRIDIRVLNDLPRSEIKTFIIHEAVEVDGTSDIASLTSGLRHRAALGVEDLQTRYPGAKVSIVSEPMVLLTYQLELVIEP